MTTAIVLTEDAGDECELMARPGSAYFAPGGTRLKSWVSLTGEWLLEEAQLAPIVIRQMQHFKDRPQKKIKNPGRGV